MRATSIAQAGHLHYCLRWLVLNQNASILEQGIWPSTYSAIYKLKEDENHPMVGYPTMPTNNQVLRSTSHLPKIKKFTSI